MLPTMTDLEEIKRQLEKAGFAGVQVAIKTNPKSSGHKPVAAPPMITITWKKIETGTEWANDVSATVPELLTLAKDVFKK